MFRIKFGKIFFIMKLIKQTCQRIFMELENVENGWQDSTGLAS